MGKKKSVFWMLVVQDLMWQTVILVGVAVISSMGYYFMKEKWIAFGEFISVVVILNMPLTQSWYDYEWFLSFHFVRKRFYRYQAVLCIIRAVELTLFRAVYQSILQKDYVLYFMEDGSLAAHEFHSVSFWELFVTNIGVFMALNFLFVVAVTVPFNGSLLYMVVADGKKRGWSPQSRLQIAMLKENHPMLYTLEYILFFFIMGVWLVLSGMLYQEQMVKPFSFRLGIIAGLYIFCIILYLIGKRRFRPENI